VTTAGWDTLGPSSLGILCNIGPVLGRVMNDVAITAVYGG
jgi:hypothetical protein